MKNTINHTEDMRQFAISLAKALAKKMAAEDYAAEVAGEESSS
jgi:hypothetical protein